MNILVDTCGWIEWIAAGVLAKQFRPYLSHPEKLLIPTVLQYELYKWSCQKLDAERASEIIGITKLGHEVTLDTDSALFAAEISIEYKLSMADAIIYSISRNHEVPLITCDNHFENLPGVTYIKK